MESSETLINKAGVLEYTKEGSPYGSAAAGIREIQSQDDWF